MGNKVKRRRHNRHAENAIAKQTQSLAQVATGLAGVSRFLEALFELTGHTVDKAKVILDRKAKEHEAATASPGGDAGSTDDVGGARPEADSEDPEGQPTSTA